MNMTLPAKALEGLTNPEKVEVMKAFYEAAGEVAKASQWTMGQGLGFLGIGLGLGIAGYAFFRYTLSD